MTVAPLSWVRASASEKAEEVLPRLGACSLTSTVFPSSPPLLDRLPFPRATRLDRSRQRARSSSRSLRGGSSFALPRRSPSPRTLPSPPSSPRMPSRPARSQPPAGYDDRDLPPPPSESNRPGLAPTQGAAHPGVSFQDSVHPQRGQSSSSQPYPARGYSDNKSTGKGAPSAYNNHTLDHAGDSTEGLPYGFAPPGDGQGGGADFRRKKSLVRPDRERVDPGDRLFHYRQHAQQMEESGYVVQHTLLWAMTERSSRERRRPPPSPMSPRQHVRLPSPSSWLHQNRPSRSHPIRYAHTSLSNYAAEAMARPRRASCQLTTN